MRGLGLIVTISCACGTTTAPTPPTQIVSNAIWGRATEVVSDPELDELAFLDGCWRRWSVDWGNEVCWKRAEDRWLGKYQSYGPMGPKETIDLVVRRRDDRLVLDVRRSTPRDGEPEHERLFASLRGPRYVVFGEQQIEMIGVGPDTIDAKVRRDSTRYRLTHELP